MENEEQNVAKATTPVDNSFLIGNFRYSIDVKGRIFLPAKFREAFVDNLVFMTKGFQRNVLLYTPEQWIPFSTEIASRKMANALREQNFFLGSACRSEIDQQGRIIISQGLRDFAGLKKDIVVVGQMSRIEIWDAEKWDAVNRLYDEDILANFADLNI